MTVSMASFANADGTVDLTPHVGVAYAELPHRHSGNCFLIRGKRPFLVDCGSYEDYPALRRNLLLAGILPSQLAGVILTHGDVDHIGGIPCLLRENPQLEVYLHAEDWDGVCEADPYRTAAYVYKGAETTSLWIPSRRFVQDGDRIRAGDTELEVIHTPGHTPGSICLLGEIDGEVLLFAGDTVGGNARKLPEEGDAQLWFEANKVIWPRSLRKLSEYFFEVVLSGHHDAPITRRKFDEAVRFFGMMMNPWFLIDDPVMSTAEQSMSVPAEAAD